MTLKTRLAKLEQGIAPKVKKYLCVIGPAEWDTTEEKAKGYKIQPCTREAGGTGGDPFYIATEAEFEKFAAREDIELDIIRIVYEDKKPADDNYLDNLLTD
jgi:hypothetical protein